MNTIRPDDREFGELLYRVMHAAPEPDPIDRLARRAVQRAVSKRRIASGAGSALPMPSLPARQVLSLLTSAVIVGLALFIGYQLFMALGSTAGEVVALQATVQTGSAGSSTAGIPGPEIGLAAVVLLLLVVHWTVLGESPRWSGAGGTKMRRVNGSVAAQPRG